MHIQLLQPHFENTFLFPLNHFGTFVKNRRAVGAGRCVWIAVTASVPAPRALCYPSFVLWLCSSHACFLLLLTSHHALRCLKQHKLTLSEGPGPESEVNVKRLENRGVRRAASFQTPQRRARFSPLPASAGRRHSQLVAVSFPFLPRMASRPPDSPLAVPQIRPLTSMLPESPLRVSQPKILVSFAVSLWPNKAASSPGLEAKT